MHVPSYCVAEKRSWNPGFHDIPCVLQSTHSEKELGRNRRHSHTSGGPVSGHIQAMHMTPNGFTLPSYYAYNENVRTPLGKAVK